MAHGRTDIYDHHHGNEPLLRSGMPVRTGIFLCVNLLLLAAGASFWQYITTGRWLDLSYQGFLEGMRVPIGQGFTDPLNCLSHPWMIPIFGLVLSVLVFTPIVVAVLYRLFFAGFFILIVAVIGHEPILALVLALGCVLAARTNLRSDMPFLAVMLGLVPVAAYLFALGFLDIESAAALPLQRWVLYGPFLLAVMASIVSVALVLLVARLTAYRPGIIWPMLVLPLAVSATLFYTMIGPGEIAYSLIVRPLAPGDALFEESTLTQWSSKHRAQGLNPQTLRVRLKDDTARRREELIGKCEEFHRRYPRSRRSAAVRWIEAQAQSLRLDIMALSAGLVQYSAGFVRPESAPAWRRLMDLCPASPQAALAKWRLGELALRSGRVSEADELLGEAVAQIEAHLANDGGRAPFTVVSVFQTDEKPLRSYYTDALLEIRRLTWLMEQNDVLTDDRSAKALAALLEVDTHGLDRSERYRRFSDLAGRYEDTRMGRNIILAAVLAIDDVAQRAERLHYLANQPDDIDAAIEANYELGQLLLQSEVLTLLEGIRTARDYFEEVLNAPASPWTQSARKHLQWLKVSTRPARE